MNDNYTIAAIAPRTRSAPGGIFTHVQEVTFVTKPSGVTGRIDLPDDDTFTPETVATAVAAKASRLEAVKSL